MSGMQSVHTCMPCPARPAPGDAHLCHDVPSQAHRPGRLHLAASCLSSICVLHLCISRLLLLLDNCFLQQQRQHVAQALHLQASKTPKRGDGHQTVGRRWLAAHKCQCFTF